MRQPRSAGRSSRLIRSQASTAIDHEDRMMRGLVHGAILALAVWVTAGCLTFMLR
jgi:hypothetical protein